ncbi:MAG: hypothetical protein ACXVY8_03350 [Gaiellaceae bacterium]
MERATEQPTFEPTGPELIWFFVAATAAAGVSLIVSGAGLTVLAAFGPGLMLGGLARYRFGNWRLAALVFLVTTFLLVTAFHLVGLGPHPSGESRLGLGGR